SGRSEIYVDAFPEPRNRVPISSGGGFYAEWSPDGRELFYLSPDARLMQVSLKRGLDSTRSMHSSSPTPSYCRRQWHKRITVSVTREPYPVSRPMTPSTA